MTSACQDRSERPWLAYSAAAIALVFAMPNLYWALGGTALLDTLGGEIEERGRDRDSTMVALNLGAGMAKVVGGFLPLALVRPWGRRFPRGVVLAGVWVAAVLLTTYGILQTTLVALVRFDVIVPGEPLGERALAWRLFVWHPWFLVWGLALGLVGWRHRHPSDRRVTETTPSG